MCGGGREREREKKGDIFDSVSLRFHFNTVFFNYHLHLSLRYMKRLGVITFSMFFMKITIIIYYYYYYCSFGMHGHQTQH